MTTVETTTSLHHRLGHLHDIFNRASQNKNIYFTALFLLITKRQLEKKESCVRREKDKTTSLILVIASAYTSGRHVTTG